jgi:hypothetical protein
MGENNSKLHSENISNIMEKRNKRNMGEWYICKRNP